MITLILPVYSFSDGLIVIYDAMIFFLGLDFFDFILCLFGFVSFYIIMFSSVFRW